MSFIVFKRVTLYWSDKEQRNIYHDRGVLHVKPEDVSAISDSVMPQLNLAQLDHTCEQCACSISNVIRITTLHVGEQTYHVKSTPEDVLRKIKGLTSHGIRGPEHA